MLNFYARLAPWLLTLIEFFLLAAAGILILFSSRKTSARAQPHAFHSIERAFARLARRRHLTVFLVGCSVVVIRVALIPILGIPEPTLHDEFGYLLAADTFAHGKLTNPTHPMWIHFESFHIIQKPTYMSMYPPAQGLVLAAGQLLGHPWIGQLLATALMCSALCWMLQAWVPPCWALFGAALAVLRLGLLSYWMNGYWSASIVALGGALVLGAWPRLRKRLRIGDAVLMALGLTILANSRPYEGLVFAIPVAFAMLFWLFSKDHPAFGRSLPRVVLPILSILLAASLATGYYYYRVTGNPLRLGYQVEADAYAAAPVFLWQTPHPGTSYHHADMRDFYHWEQITFEANRRFTGYLKSTLERTISGWEFYLGPVLTVPLLALPWVVRQRKMRLPLLICAATIAAMALETWFRPDYFSPATCALYLVLVQGMRHLSHWAPARRPPGRELVRAIPVLACAMILLRLTAAAVHVQIELAWPRGNLERAALLRQLQHLPRRQLVIVVYAPQHNFDRDWVYNDADIDAAKVLWARDMGDQQNQELLQFFHGRQAWLIHADDVPSKLEPYPSLRGTETVARVPVPTAINSTGSLQDQ
jgi:hypothetical protein